MIFLEDTTIEDVLKTVADLYNQKDFEKALKTLESNQKEISPGLWHYNMGTVYGKLENLPLSRFHFLMADAKGFSSKEMIANRDLIESKLEISRLEKPLDPSDYFIKYSLTASQGIFTTLTLIFVVLGLVSFWKKKSVKALMTFLVLGVSVLGLNFWIGTWNRSIVVETQIIHDGPSAIFGARDELPKGILLVTKDKGDWLEIIFPSRYKGWIKDSGLKELK